MKKTLHFFSLITAIVMMAMCPQTLWAQTKPASGDGQADTPFLINNAQELLWFAMYVNGTLTDEEYAGKHFDACAKLVDDIDLSSVCHPENKRKSISQVDWAPISPNRNNTTDFWNGTFNGNGKTISNLYINNTSQNQGFFGRTGENSVIENVKFENLYVKGQANVGGVCAKSYGTIQDVEIVSGTVEGSTLFIAGITYIGTNVINCTNRAGVSGNKRIAGIVAQLADNGTVRNCSNYGTITAANNYGAGIVACVGKLSTISNCANYGDIRITDFEAQTSGGPAGIVAYSAVNCNVNISNCANFGNIYITGTGVANYGLIAGGVRLNAVSGAIVNSGKIYVNEEEQTEATMLASSCTWYKGYNNTSTEYSATAAEVESGRMAYILQSYNDSPTWGQTLSVTDKEAYPVIGGQTVYTSKLSCSGEPTADAVFSNTAMTPTQDVHDTTADYDDNGFKYCPVCHQLLTYETPQMVQDETSEYYGFYAIGKPSHLMWFRDQQNYHNTENNTYPNAGINAYLLNDIDISCLCHDADVATSTTRQSWLPIGSAVAYTGTFDGNGKAINNMYIYSTATLQALFGTIGNCAEIRHLAVNGNVTTTGDEAAIIVAHANAGSTVTYCKAYGSVAGNSYSAGMIGDNYGAISHCANYSNITCSKGTNIGGICGHSEEDIIDCFNAGDVKGQTNVGGLCGCLEGLIVKNCATIGQVSASSEASGVIIGSWLVGTIEGSEKNYYVSGAKVKKDGTDYNKLIGIGQDMVEGRNEEILIPVQSEDVASGKLTLLLDAHYNDNGTWGQDISSATKDPYPVLGGTKVYYQHEHCNGDEYGDGPFTNDISSVKRDAHKLDVYPAVPVSCLINGNTYYKLCTVCNTAFDINDNIITNYITPNHHQYGEDGICTICGASGIVPSVNENKGASCVSPYTPNHCYATTVSLYLGSEINESGTITDIAFNVAEAHPITTQEVKVYMAETTVSMLGSSNQDFMGLRDSVCVYSGKPVIGNATGWETLHLKTPYKYDKNKNLFVVVCHKAEKEQLTQDLKYVYSETNQNRMATMYSEGDSTYGNLGNVMNRYFQGRVSANYITDIKLTIVPETYNRATYTLNDGDSYILPNNSQVEQFTYRRHFNNTDLAPLYVPFAMNYDDWSDKAKIYRIESCAEQDSNGDGINDETVLRIVKLKEGSKTNAHGIYLIKPFAAGDFELSLSNTVLKPAFNSLENIYLGNGYRLIFCGIYDPMIIYADQYFYMAGGKLCYSSEPVQLKSQRWYLRILDIKTYKDIKPSQFYNPSSGAKAFSIMIDDDDDVTGINVISNEATNNCKMVENGHIVITKNGKKYNINGQTLKQ